MNLKVRLLGEGLYNMLFWMYFPFITVYFTEELGGHIAGFLMTIPPLFSLIGGLVGGALADRWGRRPVMLLGAMLQTIMFALFALAPSPWLEYFAFIGVGIGGAIYRPASSAMVADIVPPESLRQVFATFMTANNIGAVAGPIVGAVFFFEHRQALLWTCAFVLLLYFIAIFMIVKETFPSSANRLDKQTPIVRLLKEQWIGYGVIFKDKVFLIYTVAGICALVSIMQLDLYLPVYVVSEVPSQAIFPWSGETPMLSSKELYGWLVGFNGLLFVLLIIPVSKWFRHWKERNIFILSSLLSGVGTFAVVLSTNIWYLFFVTIIFTLGELVRSPVTQSFISRYATKEKRGQYMGADSLQYTIGKFLAPMMVILSSWWSPFAIFTLVLTFSLVSVVLYIKLFRVYKEPAVVVD